MTALSVDLGRSRPLFVQQAQQLLAEVRTLDEIELLDPSRCRGWSRLDLLVHVRAGLDELAATVSVPSSDPVDHDAATYWRSHPDDRDDDPVPHILWQRRTSSAYSRPAAAVRHLADAADRACLAVQSVRDRPTRFQGKSMTAGDVVATWVVELAVHQLDLATGSDPVGASLARDALEALAGRPLPHQLPDGEAVLIGLGRVPWPEGLGGADGFPVGL